MENKHCLNVEIIKKEGDRMAFGVSLNHLSQEELFGAILTLLKTYEQMVMKIAIEDKDNDTYYADTMTASVIRLVDAITANQFSGFEVEKDKEQLRDMENRKHLSKCLDLDWQE